MPTLLGHLGGHLLGHRQLALQQLEVALRDAAGEGIGALGIVLFDHPETTLQPLISKFARLQQDLDDARRELAVQRTLIARRDWHARLLHGSDHPLPGLMPLYAPRQLVHRETSWYINSPDPITVMRASRMARSAW